LKDFSLLNIIREFYASKLDADTEEPTKRLPDFPWYIKANASVVLGNTF
jgi:hypothetical protein